MTHDAVQRWLDAYVDACRTYDPVAIGSLFAENATYAYHPYDEGEELDRPVDWEGWFRTRDLGELDESGYLRVGGRVDNLFISGGENVHLR